MFRKTPKKILAKPEEYIKSVGGLNSVRDLTTYLEALKSVDPSVEIIYMEKKPEFQSYLDTCFESVINSDKKTIKEVTGDMDPIRDEKRQELYKRITGSGVKIQILMNIEPWTLQNAELLREAGVEVSHNIVQGDYHFGTWAGSMMFTLFREPSNSKAVKIISQPQKEEDVNYKFLATNQPNFVEYTNNLFDELNKKATSFKVQRARLNKNREAISFLHG